MTLLWALIGILVAPTSMTMAFFKEQVAFDSDSQDGLVRQTSLPTLADLLTLEARASIFYSYAREVNTSERFSNDSDALTMFVPTNKAVRALGRKPHEDPNSTDINASDTEYEAISRSNVRRWVGSHIVPAPEVNFTSGISYDTLTEGVTISFKLISQDETVIHDDSAHFTSVKGPRAVDYVMKHAPIKNTDLASDNGHLLPQAIDGPIWRNYVMNDGIHMIEEKKASNGVLYLIDGTVNV
ncbi:hypothetical protein BU17DRAFT_93176 [Hysterangium stoloniferum]|nr:hypothetical protein BU17DRAFT_93176 [Hysterangium stoloniferum]